MSFKAYKYRIYPTKKQAQTMMKFFGCARVVYNMCLDQYNEEYKRWKQYGGEFIKTSLVTQYKKEKEFLKKCDNAALQYARTDFLRALSDFFKSKKGKRKGCKVGFPKHKKRGKSKFTYRTCDTHGTIKFSEDSKKFRLPKIGWVKCVKHREYEGNIKAVTVTKAKSDKYYISITTEVVEQKPVVKPLKGNKPNVVGLDMSLPKFLISSEESDDMIIKYQHEYRKEEERLKVLNRRLSRKVRGSKNRDKARKRLASLHEKISNRRMDFVIKTALYFARKYDVICLEDIDMQSMSRSLHLGKSVMDLGWGMFRQWLDLECKKHGSTVFKVDKWYPSSKTCNHCGYVNKDLRLSDREWICPECGEVINRDRNAACNLRDYYIKVKNTAGTAGINACGDMASTVGETLLQAVSLKQEAPSFREG